jgi:hypothetical protein
MGLDCPENVPMMVIGLCLRVPLSMTATSLLQAHEELMVCQSPVLQVSRTA